MYCLWTFSGSFRHGPFLHSVTSPIFSPLSAPTCIIYGRFTALFGRPFCIALSANQILLAPTCIVYGKFPAMWNPSLDRYGPVRRLRVLSMGVFRHCLVTLLYSPLDQSNLVGTYVHFLWLFFGIVPSPFINIQRYATPLLIFIQNPDETIDLGRPIGACRRDRVMSMDVFRQCETPLWIDMDPYGDYV